MKRSAIFAITIMAMVTFLGGCESADSRYDVGYDDGYAEGYNTECKIRATIVEGDWDDKNYSQGYQDGRAAGVAACRAEG